MARRKTRGSNDVLVAYALLGAALYLLLRNNSQAQITTTPYSAFDAKYSNLTTITVPDLILGTTVTPTSTNPATTSNVATPNNAATTTQPSLITLAPISDDTIAKAIGA